MNLYDAKEYWNDIKIYIIPRIREVVTDNRVEFLIEQIEISLETNDISMFDFDIEKEIIEKSEYYHNLYHQNKFDDCDMHRIIVIYDFINYYKTPNENHTNLLKNVIRIWMYIDHPIVQLPKCNISYSTIDCKFYIDDIRMWILPKLKKDIDIETINELEYILSKIETSIITNDISIFDYDIKNDLRNKRRKYKKLDVQNNTHNMYNILCIYRLVVCYINPSIFNHTRMKRFIRWYCRF